MLENDSIIILSNEVLKEIDGDLKNNTMVSFDHLHNGYITTAYERRVKKNYLIKVSGKIH